jgi:23S rRNA pseudouridine2605 synthase
MAEIRLNKFIASTGHCSRREADRLIEDGRVYVNNYKIEKLGTKIDDQKDGVRIDKKVLKPKKHVVIALNKPKGFVCTKKATHGEKTILELLPKNLHYLNPVGRLDKDSEGLLLLTNDGELANKLTHPTKHVEKEYVATVKGKIEENIVDEIKKGVRIEGYKTRPAKAKIIHAGEDRSVLVIELKEGKKRQIREMMFFLGHRVKKLERVRIGKYKLDTKMPRGAFAYLSSEDIKKLA